ncbi:Type II secretion system protein G precursor [compost metagenome]
MNPPQKQRYGFTIVELLIVIVIIGILAAITIVAYNGIQDRAKSTALKSDLSNAGTQMELALADAGEAPRAFPSDVKSSPDIGLSLAETGSTAAYCINGLIISSPTVRWHYDSSGGLKEGSCSGAPIALSELGTPKNLNTDPAFTLLSSSGWHMNMQNGAGTTLTTRPGASGDPFTNQPVLILSNTTAKTTAWAVLQNKSYSQADVKSGKTYLKSYYVRKTGTGYNGTTSVFGLMDGGTANPTLPNGSSTTASTSWTKLSGTSVALKDATSGNLIYMPLSPGQFANAGWTLEFQGLELSEQ